MGAKTCFQMLTCGGSLKQRFVTSFMMLMAVVNMYTMRVCLSIAIVQMATSEALLADAADAASSSGGGTTYVDDPDRCPTTHHLGVRADDLRQGMSDRPPDFVWSEATQGVVLSAFYYGYILSHVPGGLLADHFGGKHTLGAGMLCAAVTTVLTPQAAYLGVGYLIALRVLMGLGEGVTFPAVNVLMAKWVPANERGRVGAFVLAGSALGTVLGTALGGVLLYHFDWPATFHFFGALGLVWYVVWLALCYSSPDEHPFISDEERAYLQEKMQGRPAGPGTAGLAPVPWLRMLRSVPVWGLIAAQFGHDWGFYTLVTDLPKYMKSVLRFNIAQNGILSAIPYVLMYAMSVVFGITADWIISHEYWSILTVRKFFTTVASVLPALGMVGASYAGCDGVLVVTFFSAGMAGMGAYYCGMRVNGLDMTINYAGSLMALVNGLGAVAGVVSPLLIGLLTPHATLLEWRVVFWLTFGFLMVTDLIYIFTATATIQDWDLQTT